MPPEIPRILPILKETCERAGYTWRLVDDWSNNLVEVSNGKTSFFASSSRPGLYPINPHFASAIAKDKAWTYRILEQKGYKIPQGDYFFVRSEYRELRGDGREIEDAFVFAKKLGYPVFVKPNDSSLGTNAKLIESENELKEHLNLIAQKTHIAIIQKFIELPQYRIFIVDGIAQFMYQRVAQEFGKPANISAGGRIENYTAKIPEKIQNWAKKIAQDVRLRVCGIDVFASDVNNPETYIVIEINSNPSLKGICELGEKEKAISIWKEIIDKYFNETKY